MRDPTALGPDAGSGTQPLVPALLRVVQETGATAGMVYLLPPGEKVLRLALVADTPPELVAPWSRVPLTAPIPVADAVRERHLVWLGGQEEMARRYPRPALVLPYPFVLAAAPVTTGATAWGALVLLWPGSHPSRPSPHERDLINDACHRMGLLLRQAADSGHPVLPGPHPRAVARPRTRTPGPDEALAAADFAERLPEGCCAMAPDGRITFADTTAAGFLGIEPAELLGALPWQVLPWLNSPIVEDRYRAAVVGQQPTSFIARRPPDRWFSFQLYPDPSGISVRITPARVPEAPDATDPADQPHPPPPATPGRASALYHLTHLAATLTEAVGTRDVVEQVTDQLLPAFGAQALLLFVTEDDRLRVVGHRGYEAEVVNRFDGIRLSTSPSPAIRTMITDPSFYASPEELERIYPGIPALVRKAAWAVLPLTASGRPVGSLILAYDQPHPFPPEERALLTSIAGLIAQALDRARLYDTKHQLARRLQAGLLPRTLPRVPGLDVASRYLPASHGMEIGGDFYDLIRLGPAVAAAIGDVQGHNVTAAALMGQVRTAVHATAGAPPGEVLARTNRLLTDLDPGLFTSCLYVHIDLVHHRAHLATAGHPPPILRHPDGRAEVLDLPPGLLLGIDPEADYPATEVPLPPGAVLVLYTDGLVESSGVDLGDAIADLAGHLERSGHRTVHALADDLLHHAGRSVPRVDDTAVLLISPRRAPDDRGARPAP
ncbi:MAG TPA: SpoIIE family protein phosphatase [Streptomyces sp.]|uniref:SpoIIE family protein phosphatase n=1 Tax=Streptomyces sp. TaxID=1931 RepID=UPI002D3BA808|nr:SpoIIE family protein phosphatase [Streptomyces sp.]HZG03064.1 SpoIIE family protein phosphatase [Streptomyces sp.]